MARIYHSRVAADATAQQHLGTDYGLTLPMRIVFEVEAKKTGTDWGAVVTAMTGEYSVQARILAHQTDVTEVNIPSITKKGNYQRILRSLETLGVPGDTTYYYSLAAVQAHEDHHANRCRLALENKSKEIVKLIEDLRVPITDPLAGVRTAAQGLTALQALPAYAAAIGGNYTGQSWSLWFNELLKLVAKDHVDEEWCHVAERRVTRALIAQINTLVERNQWRAAPAEVALPLNALGVGAARAQVQTVAAPAPRGPVKMPADALGVAQARAQVVQAAQVAVPRDRQLDLPDGALGVAGAQARLLAAQNGGRSQAQLTPLPKKNLPVWPPPPK